MNPSHVLLAVSVGFCWLSLQSPSRGQTASEAMGFVVLDCESFASNTAQGGHAWAKGGPVAEASGYMEARPNDGATRGDPPVASRPELRYTVNFATAGTYYLWLRGRAAGGSQRTVHAGLDGVRGAVLTLGSSDAWQWTHRDPNTTTPATLTVGDTGPHTLNLWMGDPGLQLDKIILTLNPNYTPELNSEFWRNQSIYQIFTDRFCNGDPTNDNAAGTFRPAHATSVHGGDLLGIEQKLDYVKALGATAIWISPVVRNGNGEYHGYAGSDFYHVDPHLGTLATLQHLVQQAHRMGLLVIDDIVVNHGGSLVDSGSAAYATTFRQPPAGYTLRYSHAARQYAPPFDRATTPQLEDLFHNNGLIHNFGDATQVEKGELSGLDDFRTESAYVQASMIRIYQYWLATAGFDAFRIDTVKHVNMGFWQKWCPALHAAAVANQRPNFLMFGEVYDGSDAKCGSYTGSRAGGAHALDSVLDFPLYFTINNVFAKATGNTRQIENRYHAIPANYAPEARERLVTFLDNHDQPRFLSVGNANGNTSRLEVALAFLYTSRGIPCLYNGTEQGFDGGADPNNREDMFAGQFEQGPSRGDNFDMAHPLFRSVARLNNLRRLYPALRTGTHVDQWNNPEGPGIFAYARRLGEQEVLAVLNTSGTSQTLPSRPTIYPAGTVLTNLLDPTECVTVTAIRQVPAIVMAGTSAKLWTARAQARALDPVVMALSPAHDAAGVASGSPLVIHFSQAMTPATVEAAFATMPATHGDFTWSATAVGDDTLTYHPGPAGWTPQTAYRVRLETGAAASSGTRLFAAFEARFRTGAPPQPSQVPVAIVWPAGGATGDRLALIWARSPRATVADPTTWAEVMQQCGESLRRR